MTEQLTWNATVRIDSGPQLTRSGTIDVDAYTKVSEVVSKDDDFTLDVGPDEDGKIACCLVIIPATSSEHLTFKVGAKTITLDQPQFLFGRAVDLIGDQLTVKNDGEAVAVDVLLGRCKPPPKEAKAPAKKAPAEAPAKKGPGG